MLGLSLRARWDTTLTYNRQQLLDLGSDVSLNTAPLCLNFDDFPSRKASDNEDRHTRKRGGVLGRLLRHSNRPPLPTIHIVNFSSSNMHQIPLHVLFICILAVHLLANAS